MNADEQAREDAAILTILAGWDLSHAALDIDRDLYRAGLRAGEIKGMRRAAEMALIARQRWPMESASADSAYSMIIAAADQLEGQQ